MIIFETGNSEEFLGKEKNEDKFTIKFQKKLKNFKLSKDRAIEEYLNSFDVQIESILNKKEEELNLSEIIAKETSINRVAINKVLEAIEDFYKIDKLIEEVQGYDFLSDDEKYNAIKFLKRETEGELNLVYPKNLLKIIPFLSLLPPVPSLKNNVSDDELIEGFNEYMDLLKSFKEIVKKEKISGEVGLILET